MKHKPRMALGLVIVSVLLSGLFLLTLPSRMPFLDAQPSKGDSVFVSLNSALALCNVNDWMAHPSNGVPVYECIAFTLSGVRPTYLRSCVSPLFLAPLYAFAEITHAPLRSRLTVVILWLVQWLLGLLAAGLIFLLMSERSAGPFASALLAGSGAILVYFLPGPLYFFHQMYWADTLVIPWLVVLAGLEAWRDSLLARGKSTSFLDWSMGAIFLFGIILEWLVGSIFIVISLKRVLYGQFGRRWKDIVKALARFAAPLGVGFLFFTLVIFHDPVLVLAKAVHHSGILYDRPEALTRFGKTFWFSFVRKALGAPGCYTIIATTALWLIFLAVLVFRFFRGREAGRLLCPKERLLAVSFILMGVPLFHTYLLRGHAMESFHASLKFVVPLACVSMAFLPAYVSSVLVPKRHAKKALTVLAITSLSASFAMAYYTWGDSARLFGQQTDDPTQTGRALRNFIHDEEFVIAPKICPDLTGSFNLAPSAGVLVLPVRYGYPIRDAIRTCPLTTPTMVVATRNPLDPIEKEFLAASKEHVSVGELVFMRLATEDYLRISATP